MDSRAMVLTVATGVATTWLTARVMKELKLPTAASPIVGVVVAAAVNKLVGRLH
ncbi:hypothetical protein AB0K00_03995 [Dactylosporangium sp. NPDC049525]|uniref:hypothetical protein n=1 Tax=Dactylosporangium sp. NPDC049525 TaxID=3154730 RepID=UPI003439F8E3